ncbi:MAG: cobalamin transport system permease protein [Desulfonauticus sp.]|jgi:iron complex transport system permease protein|nr:MAG: ABC-type transporter, integral membrane subunit [Desulfonauticus sp. 38_4375]MDK2920922.1 cobalamin transport system permease protein [Desulfonauticus sp.]
MLRTCVFALLLLSISLILAYLSLLAGPVNLDIYHLKAGVESTIFWQIRVPRTLLAYLVGFSLATSGATLQNILNNPLAEPFTLGISSGAAFWASLALFWGFFPFGLYSLPLFSLAGAFITLLLVLYLNWHKHFFQKETLILAGIILTTFFSALISILKSLDEEKVGSIVFWILGSFANRSWLEVKIFLPFFLLGHLFLFFNLKQLSLLSLGDLEAHTLGLNPHFYRLFFFLAASILTGASVSVAGVIGFIGLVGPHLLRLQGFYTSSTLLPLSGLLGGSLSLGADILARLLLTGGEEIPVGALTALLGGPFFCLLLLKKKKTSAQPF